MIRILAFSILPVYLFAGYLWWQVHPFLDRYRTVILHRHGITLAVYSVVMVVDVFCYVMLFFRYGIFGATGQKLRHMDHHLREQEDEPNDISRRLLNEE